MARYSNSDVRLKLGDHVQLVGLRDVLWSVAGFHKFRQQRVFLVCEEDCREPRAIKSGSRREAGIPELIFIRTAS